MNAHFKIKILFLPILLFIFLFLAGCMPLSSIFGKKRFVNGSKVAQLTVIPTPQLARLNKGRFVLKNELHIFLADSNRADDAFAAKQIIYELQRSAKINGTFTSDPQRAQIFLLYMEDLKIQGLHFQNALLKKSEKINEQGYLLSIRPKAIKILAKSAQGLFYGVQSLKQLIRTYARAGELPAMEVIDWPALEYRGWQDDISRGPIPTMDLLKREIRTMAEFKQNLFTMYTEHVFKLKKHPEIAPPDGITAEQVKELVQYAKNYHVEIVGNFQSFGHFAHILKIPKYAHLGENQWVLSPALDESYRFLADVYSEIAPAYQSPLFNINCDETFGLGSGPSKAMVDSLGIGGVYAYHINHIYKLLKPYGKQLMMWGDIALSHPKIIQKLPKDIIALTWAYGPDYSFKDKIVPFQKAGMHVMVSPGVSCWSRIWPNFENAVLNISNFVCDGYRYGAIGMLNTTWDDDGENLFNDNWYQLAWGAECSWNPVKGNAHTLQDSPLNRRLQQFSARFSRIFFGDPDGKVINALWQLSNLKNNPLTLKLFDRAFWKDISETIDLHPQPDYLNNAFELKKESLVLQKQFSDFKRKLFLNANLLDFASFAAKRTEFIADREILGFELAQRLNSSARLSDEESDYYKDRLQTLAEFAKTIKQNYRDLWQRENRNWWLDTVLTKYDYLTADLKVKDIEVQILAKALNSGKMKISLKTRISPANIFYTLDGITPHCSSPVYMQPFTLDGLGNITTRAYSFNGRWGNVTSKMLYAHLALGKSIFIKYPFAPKYPAGGPLALIDGQLGSNNFKDGKWQGYEQTNLDATIDLGKQMPIDSIAVRFLQNSGWWIFMPLQVRFLISADGKNFKTIFSGKPKTDPRASGTFIETFSWQGAPDGARYIRVIGKNRGVCPFWHPAAGSKAWIFADEIIVK